jgi:hypothetical protein
MRNVPRLFRFAKLAVGGLALLQAGGCTFLEINEVVQTILLGITAAGGIAIIQNV